MSRGKRGWLWAGYGFTLVLGTLLHFTYELSGSAAAAAPVSAVNESVWEHLKLAFWPPVLFLGIEFFAFGRCQPNYWFARGVGIAVSVAAIPTVFYAYSIPLGRSLFPIDIATFVLAVSLGAATTAALLARPAFGRAALQLVGVLAVVAGVVCFTVFTFCPPHLGVFKDGTTGTYGR